MRVCPDCGLVDGSGTITTCFSCGSTMVDGKPGETHGPTTITGTGVSQSFPGLTQTMEPLNLDFRRSSVPPGTIRGVPPPPPGTQRAYHSPGARVSKYILTGGRVLYRQGHQEITEEEALEIWPDAANKH